MCLALLPPGFALVFPASEAPCSHVVSLARAELEENPHASRAVRLLAGVSLSDAEKGCHELFKQLGMCAPVEMEYVLVEGLRHIPFIKLSSWVQWLLDSNRLWRQLVGVDSWDRMLDVLGEFWARFRGLHPQHEVFRLPLDLRRTIPFYSHTDEGRTYKSKPIWMLSVHGALGRGTASYIRKQKHRSPLHRLQMGINYVGNTWSTHLLFTTMVRQLMHERPDALDILVALFANDCQKLVEEGITSADGTKHVYMLHLSTKGDLPALAKLGSFRRTYSHVARAAVSRTPSTGICHLCLAGQESDGGNRGSFPFEDFSLRPSWLPTMHTEDPWPNEPIILRHYPVDRSHCAGFLQQTFGTTCTWGV